MHFLRLYHLAEKVPQTLCGTNNLKVHLLVLEFFPSVSLIKSPILFLILLGVPQGINPGLNIPACESHELVIPLSVVHSSMTQFMEFMSVSPSPSSTTGLPSESRASKKRKKVNQTFVPNLMAFVPRAKRAPLHRRPIESRFKDKQGNQSNRRGASSY